MPDQPSYQVTDLTKLIEPIIGSAPIVMALLDAQHHVLLSSQHYKKLKHDLQAREPATLFLAMIQNNLGSQYTQTHHSDFTNQEIYLDLGGYTYPRWFVCSGTWFHTETVQNSLTHSYLLLATHETTVLKRQQEEIRMNALRALLAEEELTENMRETLAGAIHQLQGPLNLIAAAMNMLKRRSGISTEATDPLCTTLQETLAAGNQVLDNLRCCLPISSEIEEYIPLNLNELLRDVLTISTKRLLTEGIIVDWKPALILPALLGHAGRLRGLFKQLIDNAIDAMSHNRQHRELRILTLNESAMIKVVIEDTGPGIPESLRFKIFEPFFTTKKRRAGMGLATVQETVNLHAGTIRVDPYYTTGCRFIIEFSPVYHRKV